MVVVAVGAVLPDAEATCVGSVDAVLDEALVVVPLAAIALVVPVLPVDPRAALALKGLDAPWLCKAAKRFCMKALTLCATAGSVVAAGVALPALELAAVLDEEDALVPIPVCDNALTKAVAKVEAKP